MTGMSFDDEIAALLALDAPDVVEHGEEPPPALRGGTLARALSGRRPGRPVDAVAACAPSAGFDRTVADLAALLRSLAAPEWEAPAHAEHGRVRDVVAHLIGVERLVLRWLGTGPAAQDPVAPDHVAATRPVLAELAGAEPRELARQWHEAARAVAAAAVGGGDRPVAFHDLTLTADQLLVTRTAELWAHAIDICAATARPLPRLDMERMAMMCDALMAAVPLAMAYRGSAAPGRAARVVLTGPAGGTFTVPLAPAPPLGPAPQAGEPEVTIVADAVDFCRVAVRRLPADRLGAVIEGDLALGELVLASVDALARD